MAGRPSIETIESLTKNLDQIEDLIRSGRSKTALRFAKGLSDRRPKLPDEQLVRLANLLRRSGGFEDAIRLLHKKVRIDTLKAPQMAHAEYGCALVQLGLTEEAYEVLGNIDSKQFPMTLLYRALGNFSEWNYHAAVPLLRDFVQAKILDPYQRLVGRVNLLVALAYTEPSEKLFDDLEVLLKETQREKLVLLEGVVNQVRGRLLTTLNQYSKASKVLEAGLEKMKLVETFDRFYLEKWQLINEVRGAGATTSREEKFARLASRARALRDYETARDCDFYRSSFFQRPENLNFCFYGTPYSAFRARFEKLEVQPEVWLEMGRTGILSAKIKLSKSEEKRISDINETLHPGRLLHRLFLTLVSDFYRPITVPRIFRSVFHGQYWNPATSPIQVRQAIFRLRRALKKSKLGMTVGQKNQGYFLIAENEVRFLPLQKDGMREAPEIQLLRQLQETADPSTDRFTFRELEALTGKSRRSNRRIIQRLLEMGLISSEGKTRNTTYQIL